MGAKGAVPPLRVETWPAPAGVGCVTCASSDRVRYIRVDLPLRDEVMTGAQCYDCRESMLDALKAAPQGVTIVERDAPELLN